MKKQAKISSDNTDLLKTLKFIESVKNNEFSSEITYPINLSPRLDEPNIFGTEEEENQLHSFCD